MSKRDERRDARRGQYQQRQAQRQAERRRQIQRQRLTRLAITAGGIVLAVVVLFLLIHAVTGGGTPTPTATPTQHGQYSTPATGETRETLACLGLGSPPQQQHIHAYLAYYVDGKQVGITPNAGVLASCNYPVHEHAQSPNVIHVEAPNRSTYHLGDFFAIWGQYLSATRVGDHVADATHPLTFETIDQSGNVANWPSAKDPWDIPLADHETIVILYDSPGVKPTPFAQWATV